MLIKHSNERTLRIVENAFVWEKVEISLHSLSLSLSLSLSHLKWWREGDVFSFLLFVCCWPVYSSFRTFYCLLSIMFVLRYYSYATQQSNNMFQKALQYNVLLYSVINECMNGRKWSTIVCVCVCVCVCKDRNPRLKHIYTQHWRVQFIYIY